MYKFIPVHRRIVTISLLAFTALVLFNWSCTKLDTTTIGADLIPEVDNVNTFADTLDIISTQGVFANDSNRLSLTEEFALGKIDNDPLMGSTEAKLFLQLKPPFYPYYIGKQAKDTIVQADSVVLCLSYKAFWGDSTVPLQFQVYEVANDFTNTWDSIFTSSGAIFNSIKYAPFLDLPISSPKSFDVRTLGNYVKIGKGKDSVNNQIRIKLSDSFRDRLFAADSSSTGNKAFKIDSIFRRYTNGFGILPLTGKGLAYINLIEDNTRLELHYKKKNGGVLDTVYSAFYFNSGLQGETIRPSSVANQINRTRNSLPAGDQELYLQTNPGTYANLSIPELGTLTNRVIHRAELQIQQIPDVNPDMDKIFSPPPFVYMDMIDTGATTKWKPVYFDLNPGSFYNPDNKSAFYPSGGDVDVNYYGGFLTTRNDAAGTRSAYNINITRHVQQIVTRRTNNYTFRLFPAHSFSYPQYDDNPNNYVSKRIVIPYKNPIAFGRIRVGGGNNPNPAYRMRLRIIYSNIK